MWRRELARVVRPKNTSPAKTFYSKHETCLEVDRGWGGKMHRSRWMWYAAALSLAATLQSAYAQTRIGDLQSDTTSECIVPPGNLPVVSFTVPLDRGESACAVVKDAFPLPLGEGAHVWKIEGLPNTIASAKFDPPTTVTGQNTVLTVTIADNAPGGTYSYPLKVCDSTQTCLSGGVSFSVNVPKISAIVPTWGTTLGGTTVMIMGTGLKGITKVGFGRKQASGVQVVDANTVMAITPPHPEGKVDVTVSTEKATAKERDLYAYIETTICGDDRDELIEQYKTSQGGHPPIAQTLGWAPKCQDFTLAEKDADGGTKYYSFRALNNGDGLCQHQYRWALLAPPLIAKKGLRRGLDYLLTVIKEDYGTPPIWPPFVNSSYRSPVRNFAPTPCGGSTARLSTHMFGSAIDLDLDDKLPLRRRAELGKQWTYAARLLAGARYVEFMPGDPCVKRRKKEPHDWRCVHADWQLKELGALGPTAGWPWGYGKDPPPPTIGSLVASSDWRQRARAFAALHLDISPIDDATGARARSDSIASRWTPSERFRNGRMVADLLRRQVRHRVDRERDESETEYFLALIAAAGLYGGLETVPLLLHPDVVGTGNLAYKAAAQLGDLAVPTLVSRLRDQTRPEYGDLIAVACRMRQEGSVKQPGNISALDRAILGSTFAEDGIVRALAARCLRYLPRHAALPRLRAMDGDRSATVRMEVGDSLAAFGRF